MEPLTTATLAAALTALVNSTAGEAGKAAWASLKTFVTARLVRHPESADALAALEGPAGDHATAEHLASILFTLAQEDQTDRAWLQTWCSEVRSVAQVNNVVTGRAHVSGNVIQAHTINGGIKL
ncbi:hypothetical protein ODJ79_44115 [Actinoplanes sp. KI2]|uniref:hypothetical protein n=1 Tax=Actinoplanes sp. KI2 TaxID=2983315 RepID=UPI0021D5F493|nr:hypothetical protein [Actinoplanes sp. KI2]MCU7730744.1 hypothetical protein [Actinoplanes sp. KI2]